MERLLKSAPYLAQVPHCLLSRRFSLESSVVTSLGSSAGSRRVAEQKRMETLLGSSVLLLKSQLPHGRAIPAGDVRETTRAQRRLAQLSPNRLLKDAADASRVSRACNRAEKPGEAALAFYPG